MNRSGGSPALEIYQDELPDDMLDHPNFTVDEPQDTAVGVQRFRIDAMILALHF